MELTNQNFYDEISSGLVLVDFYATWCGPCKMMHPVINSIDDSHPELKVIKIDVDKHNEIARKYGVMSIPTILLFENGEIKQKNIGFIPQEVIEDWLKN